MFTIIGEVLVDMIASNDGKTLHAHYGGGPFNTAIALSRLEQQVAFHFPLSSDYYGQQLALSLQENNISYSCPYLSDDPTPLALVTLDSEAKAQYNFYMESTSGCDLRQELLQQALPETTKVIHTGTLAIASTQNAHRIKHILLYAKQHNSIISVDPNIRAVNFSDKKTYKNNVLSIMRLADILKLSDEDMSFLYPNCTMEEALLQIKQECPECSLIVVTAGAHSIVASSRACTIDIKPQAKTIVGDTIGAGDCFAAGLLFQCHQDNMLTKDNLAQMNAKALTRLVHTADTVAGLNCQKEGCNPPYLNEL